MIPKYARFVKPFPHYQIDKFNGTKGYVEMTPDNVGVYNPGCDMYVFDEVNGVIPQIFSKIILAISDKNRMKNVLVATQDAVFENFADEDDKKLSERFEKRLFLATSQLDVDTARMYFEAAQIDRLSIKASIMKLTQTPHQ